jgi:hypothetical protein
MSLTSTGTVPRTSRTGSRTKTCFRCNWAVKLANSLMRVVGGRGFDNKNCTMSLKSAGYASKISVNLFKEAFMSLRRSVNQEVPPQVGGTGWKGRARIQRN